MPSNFNQTMDAPQVGNVSSQYEPDTTKDASLIQRMGESVKSFGSLLKAQETEDNLGQVSYELADLENQAIAYNQQYADLHTQMANADETVARRASDEMQKLRAGLVQGALSPSAAMMRTNNVIKKYSVAYPHLAKDIRAMANQAMDNYDQYYKQIVGNDPIVRKAQETAATAFSLNTTPSAIIRRDAAVTEAEAILANLKRVKETGDLNKDTALSSIQTSAASWATGAISNASLSWSKELTTTPLTEQDAKGRVSRLKAELYNRYVSEMVKYGTVSTEEINSTLAPAMMQLDNFERIITASGTVENQLAYLKNIAEDKRLKDANANSQFHARLRQLLGPLDDKTLADTINAAAAVAMSSLGKESQLWDDSARNAMVANQDPSLMFGLRLIRSNEGQEAIFGYLGTLVKGSPQSTGNASADAIGNRKLDEMLGHIKDSNERVRIVSGAFTAFDWQDIMRNPTIRLTVQNDPALRLQAANKAAASLVGMARFYNVDPAKLIVDHSDFANPIKVKGEKLDAYKSTGRASQFDIGATLQAGPKLSQLYRDVLNTLGAEGVDAMIKELELEAPPKTDKAQKKSLPKPEEVVSKVIDYNKSFGLPEAAIRAVMDQESSGGKFLRASNDPKTGKPLSSARGPMHILKGTFEDTNKNFFGGQLDWDNEDHQILASLAHFKFLYNKHRGDVGMVFRRWYGSEIEAENDKYAASVQKKMERYGS